MDAVRAKAPHRTHRVATALSIGMLWLAMQLSGAAQASEEGSGLSLSELAGLPADAELPEQSTDKGTLSRSLRPTLDYPTLRLDDRKPPAVSPPAAQSVGDKPCCGAPTPWSCNWSPPPVATEAPRRPAPRSTFEALVEQTLGAPLPLYGMELFRDPARSFDAVDQANVPADFVIAPGDDLIIRAWGSIELDIRTTVARDGTVGLSKIGDIGVAGVRFGDLARHLRAAIGRSYTGFDLSVSIGQLHSIRIYVTGFAKTPGAYTVNSLSTLINAIFQAGGPLPEGDLRRVELRRGNAQVAQIDLYDFIANGHRDGDARLQPDDVIVIPPVRGVAAVAGSVSRPARFQLNGDTLGDLIGYAGGLDSTAAVHRATIERVVSGSHREIVELEINAENLRQPVRNGDLVLIAPISPRFTNAVTLRGQVAQPIRYPWRPGLRVSDVIPSREALVNPGYWIARNERSHLVDLLRATEKTDVKPDFPDIHWDYAVVERIDEQNLRAELVPFDLGRAVLQRDPEQNLLLQPNDIVTVFARGDFRVPLHDRAVYVRVEGEVNRPGLYPLQPNETWPLALEKAGGVTPNAYVFGIEFNRESVRRQQEKRIGEAIDKLEQEYQRHLIDRSRNVLDANETIALPAEAQAISGLIGKLRSVRATGRIVLDLPPGTRNPRDLPALRAEQDDMIYVPPVPETIEVVGAVYRETSFIYRPGKRLREYLQQAVALPSANESWIYIVRADGSLVRERDARPALLPGDTIIVPEKVDRVGVVRRLKDWTQVLYQFGLGAAGLKILKDG